MRRILFFLLVGFTTSALSEVYLCSAIAGGSVVHGGSKKMTATVLDVAELKYVLSDSSGKWVLTRLDFGPEYPIFRECQSQYYCKPVVPDGFVSNDYFSQDKDGTFEIVYSRVSGINSVDDLKEASKLEHTLLAVKGRCQKL